MSDKQPLNINFAQGLDQKSDPKQIPMGKFYALNNSIFTKAGLLAKRNGFGALSTLPNTTATFLTTFNGNLTALGETLQAYSRGSDTWVDKGNFQPIAMSTLPVARSTFNQTQCDSIVSTSGLICTVFTEVNNGTAAYKYVVQDSETGQNIVGPAVIPVASGTVTGSPRVFILGGYFLLVFTNVITATSHLQYVSVSISDPTVVSTEVDLAAVYTASTTLSWDGVVTLDKFFFAYNTQSGGQQIKFASMNTNFVIASAQSFAASIATIMSVCADESDPSNVVIYAAFYDLPTTAGYVIAVNPVLNKVMTPTQIISTTTVLNMTCTAQNGICEVAWEVSNAYSYDSNIKTNFLRKVDVTKPATVTTGTVGTTTIFARSVGLASKAFLMNEIMYVLTAYDGKSSTVAAYQPTYFLLNISGQVIAKIAYQNGGGYLTLGLPQGQVVGTKVNIAYLLKDLIQSVNKEQGAASSTGIYSQTGVNMASMIFDSSTLSTAEIGNNLNISGGFLYAYDGNTLNEQNFHLYPDSVEVTVSHSGGSMIVQDYFYQVIYQWTDAQGNIFYSAPSVPVKAASASFSGSSNSVTVNVPTARLTYKPGIKIIIYRWSTAQQEYFQVTSISAPLVNSTTVDSVAFVDTLADTSIIGNSLIYTTGGVIEDTGSPACTALTLFDTRLWAINAEDQNLLNYSKPVIEGTPVEMSDLISYFVAPNAGVTGSTGPMKCIFPMDDKLIVFKSQSLFYINGTGPDITGANSQYSQPIFITSTVGCTNQNSIVLTPLGLMFQSDKGIWLLGRDLQTSYIGAAVENYNSANVTSAVAVPKTTQVRFTLDEGTTLMFDYFYQQWGTFAGVSGLSSTIYQNFQTILSESGMISQETPGTYLDNGNPVLMSFTTSWINMAGLRGYQRLQRVYFLGTYYTPHKLVVGIAYNYAVGPLQTITINPLNFTPAYGNDPIYGDSSLYGGMADPEQWELNPRLQKCKSFQLTFNEYFDSTFGVAAGAGFDMSGLLLISIFKKGYAPIRATQTAG